MAQKVEVQLVDDLDGSTADASVEFGLDGVSYTIDLSEENAGQLREELAPYINSARRAGGRKKRATAATKGKVTARGSTAVADREQNQAIRAWARKKGYQISDRGRIPWDIMDAYEKSTKKR